MELPFELYKNHKAQTKYNWKKIGLKEETEKIEDIYQYYIICSNCELCGEAFTSLRNRHMDHDHKTGKFRNIVCTKCNHNRKDNKSYSNTGYRWISKSKKKNYVQGFGFTIRIDRNGKNVLATSRKTLEEAIEVRNKFIEENPELFT